MSTPVRDCPVCMSLNKWKQPYRRPTSSFPVMTTAETPLILADRIKNPSRPKVASSLDRSNCCMSLDCFDVPMTSPHVP